MSEAVDRRWLDAAARQALPFLGSTGRVPAVAAIVVGPAGTLLGRAVATADGPGAETLALTEAGAAAQGTTVYMTLAPLAAEPLIAAGIARLVVGTRQSPVPEALAALRQAGSATTTIERPLARRLHEGYFSVHDRGRPFVTAILAVSADGMAGWKGRGDDRPILGDAARRWRLLQATLSDAVLSGWRAAAAVIAASRPGLEGLERRQPLRIVLAGRNTYRPAPAALLPSLVGAGRASIVAIPEKRLETPGGVDLIRVPGSGRPALAATLTALAQRGIHNLLVETGPILLEALLEEGLIDRFHLLVGERAIGSDGLPAAARGGMETRLAAAGFSLVDHRLLGADNLRTFERLSS